LRPTRVFRIAVPGLSAALLGGCSGAEVGSDSGGDRSDTPFVPVAEGLPAALVSVNGRAADDLYAVGADAGGGPLVLRRDAAGWRTVSTGTRGDLWWAHPVAGGAVLVGADGQILTLDDATGAFTAVDGPAGTTFFGVWGASDGELWAVGGDVSAELPPAIWRRLGGAWAPLEDPLLDGLAAPTTLYKVHGTAADDVWIVGSGGIVLHWDGAALVDVSPGVASNLYTVHCGGGDPVAVGGYGQSVVLEREAGAWVDRSPAYTPQTNGVYVRGDTRVAVGARGSVLRGDGWAPDEAPATSLDLHGVYVDPDGGVWAAGGALASTPMTDGMLLYDGPGEPGSLR
jgi:hypothetical protein